MRARSRPTFPFLRERAPPPFPNRSNGKRSGGALSLSLSPSLPLAFVPTAPYPDSLMEGDGLLFVIAIPATVGRAGLHHPLAASAASIFFGSSQTPSKGCAVSNAAMKTSRLFSVVTLKIKTKNDINWMWPLPSSTWRCQLHAKSRESSTSLFVDGQRPNPRRSGAAQPCSECPIGKSGSCFESARFGPRDRKRTCVRLRTNLVPFFPRMLVRKAAFPGPSTIDF